MKITLEALGFAACLLATEWALAQTPGTSPLGRLPFGASAASGASGASGAMPRLACQPSRPELGLVTFKGTVRMEAAFDMEDGMVVKVNAITGAEQLDERNRLEVERAVREAVMKIKCTGWEGGRREIRQSFSFRVM
jgi:hypothetical protein